MVRIVFLITVILSSTKYLAQEGEPCGGFAHIHCERGLQCVYFTSPQTVDRHGICLVRSGR